MNTIAEFKRELSEYLYPAASPCDNLVKFESNSTGDFSLVRSFDIWNIYKRDNQSDTKSPNNGDIITFATKKEKISEAIEILKKESENWSLKIDRILEYNEKRYVIHLDRNHAFNTAFGTASIVDLLEIKKDGTETMSIQVKEKSESDDISWYRLRIIQQILKNLIEKATKYVLVNDPSTAKRKLVLSTDSHFKSNDKSDDDRIRVNCGVVLGKDNKKSQQLAGDYVKKRTNDMHLIAIHKYGICAMKNDEKFLKMVEKLGAAAATLDMIEVNHLHALNLSSTNLQKQSFILYNSARLQTLISTFNDKVNEGYYTEVGGIDAALLTENLEWELLKLILLYPETIQKTVYGIESGKFSLHSLYKYLYLFSAKFSTYYSKIKILTENRPHLIPALHAKIYLLKVIQKYFNEVLSIFNIEPVSFM